MPLYSLLWIWNTGDFCSLSPYRFIPHRLHPFFTISLTPSLFLTINVIVNLENFGKPYILMSEITILEEKKYSSSLSFLVLRHLWISSESCFYKVRTLDKKIESAFYLSFSFFFFSLQLMFAEDFHPLPQNGFCKVTQAHFSDLRDREMQQFILKLELLSVNHSSTLGVITILTIEYN